VTSVASFTLGAVVAQLLVLGALVPVLRTLFRIAISERVGVIVGGEFTSFTVINTGSVTEKVPSLFTTISPAWLVVWAMGG
jgi:hypothetical protein